MDRHDHLPTPGVPPHLRYLRQLAPRRPSRLASPPRARIPYAARCAECPMAVCRGGPDDRQARAPRRALARDCREGRSRGLPPPPLDAVRRPRADQSCPRGALRPVSARGCAQRAEGVVDAPAGGSRLVRDPTPVWARHGSTVSSGRRGRANAQWNTSWKGKGQISRDAHRSLTVAALTAATPLYPVARRVPGHIRSPPATSYGSLMLA
jgi:hypothetical protein